MVRGKKSGDIIGKKCVIGLTRKLSLLEYYKRKNVERPSKGKVNILRCDK